MQAWIAMIENYSFSREPLQLGVEGLVTAARKLEDVGFDGIISPETAGHDPFFPLLLAAEHTERIGLSTGIAVSFPRSPMVVAQMAWDLQRFSGGRFQLGLGTQVKGHNERRYSTPWTAPAGPRMREYVLCLKAILESFQNSREPRYFEGEHYQFTMLPPVFTPRPIEHPHIPVYIAAVNPYMCRVAGEVCEGVFAHPVCTAKYVKEVMLPNIAEGARKADRRLSDINLIGAPIVVTGRNKAELEEEKKLHRRRVSFYASTRTYHSVFKVHGWHEMGLKLHEMSLENRWKEMAELIPDEMAEEFATIGLLDEIGPKLRERWGGTLSTISFPTDFPLETRDDEKRAQQIIESLRAL
jgi:probable F420-dependent oxidoreductase